jgi:predicted glycosyltransferase
MRRIALYSQDTHGLGRLRRNIAIARALADGEPRSILLISGAGEAAVLKLPEGVDTLTLPSFGGGEDGVRGLGIGTEAMLRVRAETLRSALAAFEPDALIVDRLPTGVEGELTPSFDLLHEMGTRLVLGLPEVLGDAARVRADWQGSNAYDVLRRHYDAVWVYGDPNVFDPVADCDMPRDIAEMVHYSGYLDGYGAGRGAAERERAIRDEHGLGDGPLCVCLAGGNDEGVRLAETFARAPLPAGTAGVVLTGPFIDADDRAGLEALAAGRDDLHVIGLLPDADTLIWMADQVIAMGGYHTTCEALAAGKRALIVPSADRRPDQLIRAERLAAVGALDLMLHAQLTPAALGAWVAGGPREPEAISGAIDTDGLRRLPMMLEDLAAPAAVPAPHRRAAQRWTREPRVIAATETAAATAVVVTAGAAG